MKCWHPIALGALLSFSPGPARAENIEISYSWSLSQQVIAAPGGNQIIPVYQPTGTVSAPVDSTAGRSIPGILWDASSRPNTWPAADFNATVNVKLALTDVASGQSTQFDYQLGFKLEGTGTFHYLYVTESPTGPPTTLGLGNYLYKFYPNGDLEPASLGLSHSNSFLAPSSFDPVNVWGIDPLVRVSYAPGVQTPEPSTLVLGGIGALGLVLARRGRSSSRR